MVGSKPSETKHDNFAREILCKMCEDLFKIVSLLLCNLDDLRTPILEIRDSFASDGIQIANNSIETKTERSSRFCAAICCNNDRSSIGKIVRKLPCGSAATQNQKCKLFQNLLRRCEVCGFCFVFADHTANHVEHF